jgi:hypothetical protein
MNEARSGSPTREARRTQPYPIDRIRIERCGAHAGMTGDDRPY